MLGWLGFHINCPTLEWVIPESPSKNHITESLQRIWLRRQRRVNNTGLGIQKKTGNIASNVDDLYVYCHYSSSNNEKKNNNTDYIIPTSKK